MTVLVCEEREFGSLTDGVEFAVDAHRTGAQRAARILRRQHAEADILTKGRTAAQHRRTSALSLNRLPSTLHAALVCSACYLDERSQLVDFVRRGRMQRFRLLRRGGG